MRFIRIIWMVVLVLGVMAVTETSAASASEYPGWVVNEVPLATGETAAITATNSSAMTLEASGLLTLTAASGNCTITGSLKGTGPEAPDELENAFLSCTGMTVKGSEGCQVHTGKEAEGVFKTDKLKGTLAWIASTGSATGVILKAASGTQLASVVIQAKSGKGCVFEGTSLLSNEVLAKFLPVEEEAETAELSFPSTPVLAYWSNATPRVEGKLTRMTFGSRAATLATAFAVQLQLGGKQGAAPKAKTKLCKVAPAPKCAAGNVYPSTPAAKLAIEAADEYPAQSQTKIQFLPEPDIAVECGKSKLKAETEEAEANPLAVKGLEISFEECVSTEAGFPGCEVKMTNKPINGSLEAMPLQPGRGVVSAPVLLFLKCETGGVIKLKCEYKANNAGLLFAGAMIASLRPAGPPLVKQGGVAGETGCTPTVRWGAYYAVSKPAPVWPSE
jgi:hypothetical protein